MDTHLSYAVCNQIGQLKTSSYQLEIEMDRYAYKYMEVRICQLCHMEVESKQYPHHLSHQQIKSIITWHQKVHSLL